MLFLLVLMCLTLNISFSNSQIDGNSDPHPFLLHPDDNIFDINNFTTRNTSFRKTSADGFGVDAYCVLVTEIINNNIFNIQMKIFYTKEVNRVNSKINKDICLSYETEYYNFITELEKKRYFSHICPIVPGLYYVNSYKYKGPTIPESVWDEIINNIKEIMKNSLKLQCQYDSNGKQYIY